MSARRCASRPFARLYIGLDGGVPRLQRHRVLAADVPRSARTTSVKAPRPASPRPRRVIAGSAGRSSAACSVTGGTRVAPADGSISSSSAWSAEGVLLIGAARGPELGPQVAGDRRSPPSCSRSRSPNFAAATADVLPARIRGTGFALFTFLLTLGGALGPLVVGGCLRRDRIARRRARGRGAPDDSRRASCSRGSRHGRGRHCGRAATRARLPGRLGADDADVAHALARRAAEVVGERELLARGRPS